MTRQQRRQTQRAGSGIASGRMKPATGITDGERHPRRRRHAPPGHRQQAAFLAQHGTDAPAAGRRVCVNRGASLRVVQIGCAGEGGVLDQQPPRRQRQHIHETELLPLRHAGVHQHRPVQTAVGIEFNLQAQEFLIPAALCTAPASPGVDHQRRAQLAAIGQRDAVRIQRRHRDAGQQSRRLTSGKSLLQGSGQTFGREAAVRQVECAPEARKCHPIAGPAGQRQARKPGADVRRRVGAVKAPGVIAGRPVGALDQRQTQGRLGVQQGQRDQSTVQPGAGDHHVVLHRLGGAAWRWRGIG